nr:DUF4368 domain-containing protein [Dielma fastidiosa]
MKKIIVYAPDKSTGHRRQWIEIVWNFIGELEQTRISRPLKGREKAERHSF